MIFTNKRLTLWAAGGAMTALLAAGCSHQDETPPAQVNTTTVSSPAVAPGTAVTTTTPGATTPPGPGMAPSTNNTNAGAGGATGTQTDVASAVNKAIHNNAQMTGSRVTAVVDASGVARLTGTAQNQQQKALAVSTTRQTAGVSSVTDKIEIVPTGGVKAAAPPPPKTKIVVVHDKAPMPAPPAQSTTPPGPKGPVSGSMDNSTPPPATGGTAGTDSTSTPPASSTGTTGQ